MPMRSPAKSIILTSATLHIVIVSHNEIIHIGAMVCFNAMLSTN
jgi:hypothetical protein